MVNCARRLAASCESYVNKEGGELLEGHALPDHVHLCLSIPPKYSVSHTVGFLNGKSAIRIHRELLGERRMTGLHFWAKGYCVSSVGYDEAAVRRYIREQEEQDNHQNRTGERVWHRWLSRRKVTATLA